MKYFFILFLTSLIVSCSNRPCKEVDMSNLPASIAQESKETIFVFKYDGTRQCKQGQEITLDAMSKELREVKIISMNKKNDGMMRMQVCGAPTGQANVYEVPQKEAKKVKSYGFEIWKY